MKYIKKIAEPAKFKAYRSIRGATYAGMALEAKKDLRDALLISQGYICCYCMQRVAEDNCKIEHFKPQTIYNGENGKPNLTLNYLNLFIACTGNEGQEYKRQTCDTRKGPKELHHVRLLEEAWDNAFKYSADGTISTIVENKPLTNEMEDMLNLNEGTLKRNRSAVYKVIIKRFQEAQKEGRYSIAFLNKELKHWQGRNAENQYQEYCMVAVYLIQKHIIRIQNQQKGR